MSLDPESSGSRSSYLLLGPWMLEPVVAYTTALYTSIPTLVGS